MYPYIIMKLSKKKIQKLYKSKNQTRKSGGKKSFKPKQNNHRSRKAGALNLRRRTLRKMKGGGGEEDKEEKIQVVGEENVTAPEETIKVELTEKEVGDVFEGFTKAREGENNESVANNLTASDEEKRKEKQIVSFNNLSTYKEFMTKLANLILKKLNEVYKKKISDMKKELLKKIEGEQKSFESEVVKENTTIEGEAVPTEGEAVPTEGQTVPAEGKAVPDARVEEEENTEIPLPK